MKTKQKTNCSIVRIVRLFDCGRVVRSIIAVALCAVGLSAFAEPEAVQLWENGPYFATCDVGATQPEEYGYYFWWGDTVGYKRNAEDNGWVSADGRGTTILFSYSDSTANQTYGKDAATLKSEGWVDDSGNLVVSDDAATNRDAARAHLGAPWRMPTFAELELLTNTAYCVSIWTNDYNKTGVAGRIVTGVTDGYTDKSIFLPAAGYGNGAGLRISGSGGNVWSSAPNSSDSESACDLEFDSDTLMVGDNTAYRSVGFAVRAVRDTPPKQEISAVSEEGWLDLTVGDRVAQDKETIVVDPAWGDATTATVQIDGEASARSYTALTIDTWDTTTLAPGRYGMTLTAGTIEGEDAYTAGFWKIDKTSWEVLDNSNITADVTFAADKTYLMFGTNTVSGATLTVQDRAKFAYGEGAGFLGGTVAELPRRYKQETVEGDLYRIVEAIKGCEDNPWDVGVGVEAYTNGTELVIAGAGTIADLSAIPAGVKGGIAAITVADATVKDAVAGAFFGFDKVTVTLPDNWQGELPDEKDTWCGATNVELTRWPMAVKNVKPQQRYPWNGLVDVDFDLSGEGAVKVTLSVTADGEKLKNPTVTSGTTFNLGKGKELKELKLTWDAKADFGDAEKHEKIKVKLSVSSAEAN